jgi:ribosomal protein L15
MREREREGAHGGMGARGTRGMPGQARLGRGPGRKPTTHTTTDQEPIANQNPKRGDADAR